MTAVNPDDHAPRAHVEKSRAVRRGLVIVYTGDGKGKTTAALGLAFRSLGRRYRVAVVQFIKGQWRTGEARMAGELRGRIDWFTMGNGFTWLTQSFEQDVASARRAWAKCAELLDDPRYDVVIFDELNCVIAYNFLPVEEVIEALRRKRPRLHVVITGRDAAPSLIAVADLVTEMREVKHPYQSGISAQPGVDY